MFPFSNSAPTQPPAPVGIPASGYAFEFDFSGVINASEFEIRPLEPPFSDFQLPATIEIPYSLQPSDFRTNNGGVGTFSFSFSSQDKNFGVDIQASSPSELFIVIYTNYRASGPDEVTADRMDYAAVWPDGTPTIRVTIGADAVPHLYFDGVEAILAPSSGGEVTLPNGDYSTISAVAFAPDLSVVINGLRFVSSLIPPPGTV